MKNPQGVMKRWSIFIGIVAVVGTVLGAGMLTAGPAADPLTRIMGAGFFFAAALLWVALVNSLKKNFKLAGIFSIIAGVVTLPIGVLLIIAGIRILSAGRHLSGLPNQTTGVV
jgi:hypothetical protein